MPGTRATGYALLVFTIMLVFPGISVAEERPDPGNVVRIVYDESWRPVSWLENGQVKGILPDRLEEILEKSLGLKVKHVAAPWARAQHMVKQGLVDAIVATATDSRLEFASATKVPVFFIPVVLLTPADSGIKEHPSPDDLSAFSGDLFCDVLGNGWAKWFYTDKPVQVYYAPRLGDCLKMLINHRAKGIVHARAVAEYYAKSLDLADKITFHPAPSAGSPSTYLLVSKKSPWHQRLEPLVDSVLTTENATGENQPIQ